MKDTAIRVHEALAEYYACEKALAVARKKVRAAMTALERKARVERENFGVRMQKTDAGLSPRIAVIVNLVAEIYAVQVEGVVGKRQTREYTEPRHVAIYLACECSDLSLTQIAAGFGMAATSCVKYGRRIVLNRIACEPRFSARIEELRVRVLERLNDRAA